MPLQIVLSSQERDELPRLLERHLPAAQAVAGELLDQVWSRWRDYQSVQLSVTFLDPKAMAELNGQYRQEPHPTDVLSFPLWETPQGTFEPDSSMTTLPLGDVVICPSVLDEQARAEGCSPLSQLALVLIHGLLHLLAWDHGTPEEEEKMWAVQQRYRQRLLEEIAQEAPEGLE